MAERILMNEFKGLLKEKWVHVEVSQIVALNRCSFNPIYTYIHVHLLL
jgi:hypothetical protein